MNEVALSHVSPDTRLDRLRIQEGNKYYCLASDIIDDVAWLKTVSTVVSLATRMITWYYAHSALLADSVATLVNLLRSDLV